ncbi:DNA methyltransferase [Leuconostoc gasicomitatum]|uniref:DNA methyltransferase n=1 Tax=Leuconostoc gasicomitatum TaxID=115778 RepID=UPI001CC7EABC|nr:DNA methyltransferase [Leuconostoc gasicomitatum]MBZ5950287.1 hypothetical protein [Leuconostoc gasicomitatum]
MTIVSYKELPSKLPFGAEVSIDTTSVTPLTHGFHKYPGKFIPQIPEWAIKTYITKKEQIILDPFVGSGTTLVEAIANGNNAFGVDIDPLSSLISKVKSTPLNPKIFLTISDWIMTNKEIRKPIFIPETDNLEHWFTDEAIIKLSKLRTLIDEIPMTFKNEPQINDYYEAFIIAFSGIIRRVSNADNQSQKTYVSGTKPKKPAEVFSLFEKQLKVFLKGYEEFNLVWDGKSKATVLNSDGDSNFVPLISEKVDLIITSPPYIKSIDYVYNQMVELFWVGDLFSMDTQVKQNEKRKLYTGTTLVPKKAFSDFFSKKRSLSIPLMDNIIKDVLKDEKNGEKHAFIVYKYFEFMDQHFEYSNMAMNKGAHYVMAVGNSTVSNVKVQTSDILIEIAKNHGLILESQWSYVIKNHFMGFDRGNRGGKINVDHVLVFKK